MDEVSVRHSKPCASNASVRNPPAVLYVNKCGAVRQAGQAAVIFFRAKKVGRNNICLPGTILYPGYLKGDDTVIPGYVTPREGTGRI